MKDKKETIINVFNQLKEIWKNPRGRSIIMLVLYFFFFLFIIMGLRNGHKVDNTEKKDTTSDLDYSIEKIKKSNYHYKYLVDYNNNLVLYEGDKNNDKELFTKKFNNLEENYYNYQEKYYKNINGVWSKTDNPYLYSEYLDFTNLEKILNSATYDSKTEYNNGSKLYTYDISTTTLVKIINKEDIDIADNPNKIIVTTNKNNEATKFEFYLTPYVNYKDNNSSSILNISLEYSNFGKVDEIKNPE